jgi:hypothetical protein
MSNVMLENEEARPEIDGLLHGYFRTEMPSPWPAFQIPRPMRTKRPASFWSRYGGRLALAASIALLVASYLALAGFFPRLQAPTGVEREMNDIGHIEKGTKTKVPTPHEE